MWAWGNRELPSCSVRCSLAPWWPGSNPPTASAVAGGPPGWSSRASCRGNAVHTPRPHSLGRLRDRQTVYTSGEAGNKGRPEPSMSLSELLTYCQSPKLSAKGNNSAFEWTGRSSTPAVLILHSPVMSPGGGAVPSHTWEHKRTPLINKSASLRPLLSGCPWDQSYLPNNTRIPRAFLTELTFALMEQKQCG